MNIIGGNGARRWRWLVAAAGLLAVVANAGSLQAAWSGNLAYLRLDVLLRRSHNAITLQSAGQIGDWPAVASLATSYSDFTVAYGLGLTALSGHAYPLAVAAFQAALAANPQHAGTHGLLGDAEHGLGDDAEAVAEWQTGSALPVLLARGDARGSAGDWPGAIDWYMLATRVDPQSAQAFAQLGQAENSAGQHQAAIGALLTAVALAPGDMAIRHTLGLTYEAQGDLAAAAEQFQLVLAATPDDYYTNLYMVSVQLSLGQVDAAETYALKSTQLGPNDPRAHYALASVYARRLQWPDAIAELKTALGLVPAWNKQSTVPIGSATVLSDHLLLARAYQATGQSVLAVSEYQAVLLLDPKNAEARAALKKLQAVGQS